MKLGFHGATTMYADLQTDVAVTAQAMMTLASSNSSTSNTGLETWISNVEDQGDSSQRTILLFCDRKVIPAQF